MANGVELATAYISILPELGGLRRSVGREFNSISARAGTMGARSGRNTEKGFNKATKGRLGRGAYADLETGATRTGQRSGRRFGGEFMGAVKGTLAGIGTYLVFDQVAQFFTGSVSEASNLEQSVGGLKAVFKDSFGAMNKESKDAALNLGLTRNEYNELATVLGSSLKNKGIKDYADETQNLVGIGADLAAQFGGSTKEATDALAAALRGESDPIERYGVSLNEAAISAELAKTGQDKLKGAALEQAKTQARLKLITEQTTDAQGAFSRESNTLAGQQQRLHGQIGNIQASLGKLLIPYLTKGATWLNKFLTQMQKGDGIGGQFKNAMQGIYNLIAKGDFTGEMSKAFGIEEDHPAVDQILDIRDAFVDAFSNFGADDAKSGVKGMLDGIGPLASIAAKAIGWMGNNMDKVGKALPYLIAGFAAYKGLQAANNVLGRDSAIGMGIQLGSTISLIVANRKLAASMQAVATSQKTSMATQRAAVATENAGVIAKTRSALASTRAAIAERARTAATKASIVVQKAFNAVMSMNPLAKVVLILAAVGAALVLLYKKNETFRNFVNAAWESIRSKVSAVADWFRATIVPYLAAAWKAIGSGARSLWSTYLQPAFSSIRGGATATFGFFRTWVWPVVKGAFDLIRNGIRVWWAGVKIYFNVWRRTLTAVFGFLRTWVWPVVKGAFNLIRNGIRVWWAGVKIYFNAWRRILASVFGFLRTWVWPLVKGVFKLIGNAVRNVYTRFAKPYLGFIRSTAASVFGWIKNTGWPWIRATFSLIGKAAKTLWSSWIKPYFGFILKQARTVFGWIKNKGWPAIRSAFNSIGSKAQWLWKTAKVPFDALKRGVGGVKTAVSKAAGGIKTAWNKLNGYLRSPIRKALTWMNNNFIGGVNKLLSTKILRIPKSWRIPKIKGFDRGGWTGHGGKYDPAGIVHADEYVVRKESQRSISRAAPGFLDALNRYGARALDGAAVPGYRIGGKVNGLNARFKKQLDAFNEAAGGRYSVYSGYRSNAKQAALYARYLAGRGPVAARPGSSQHNKGLAADLAPSNARDVHGHLAKRFGLAFTVPSESWHIEPTWGRKGGGGKGGSFFGGLGLPSWLSNPLKWVKDKVGNITKKFDGSKYGIAGQALPAVFKKLKDVAGNKIKKAADSLMDFGGGGMSVSGVIKGASVQRWAGTVRKALGIVGQSQSPGAVQMVLRRLNQESGGNYRAINNWDSNAKRGTPSKGLMQVIGPTFRAYRHPRYSGNIYDPLSNILASMRYALSRYGSLSSAYNRKGGYADGGLAKALEFDRGGYLPRGRSIVENNTGKPEPLKRTDLDTPGGSGDIYVYVQDPWGGEYHEGRMMKVVQDNDDFKSSLERMG